MKNNMERVPEKLAYSHLQRSVVLIIHLIDVDNIITQSLLYSLSVVVLDGLNQVQPRC